MSEMIETEWFSFNADELFAMSWQSCRFRLALWDGAFAAMLGMMITAMGTPWYVGFGVAAFLGVVVFFGQKARTKNVYKLPDNQIAFAPRQVSISSGTVWHRYEPGVETKIPIACISNLKTDGKYIRFTLTQATLFVVPLSAFKSAGDMEQGLLWLRGGRASG